MLLICRSLDSVEPGIPSNSRHSHLEYWLLTGIVSPYLSPKGFQMFSGGIEGNADGLITAKSDPSFLQSFFNSLRSSFLIPTKVHKLPAKVAKQTYWNHTSAWVFSYNYLFLRTPLGSCFWKLNQTYIDNPRLD